jgi:sortase A
MRKRKLAILLMTAGVILVLGAAGLLGYNRWSEDQAGDAALNTARELLALIEVRTETGSEPPEEPEQMPEPGESEAEPEPVILLGTYEYLGVLSIPALGLDLPVMREWSYPRLKVSPCRYSGSAAGNDMVIAAHNYSRHFGRIAKLRDGDAVVFTDALGNAYRYRVAAIETIEAKNAEEMTHSEYALTLFTCTYGGQARVAVRCDAANG